MLRKYLKIAKYQHYHLSIITLLLRTEYTLFAQKLAQKFANRQLTLATRYIRKTSPIPIKSCL